MNGIIYNYNYKLILDKLKINAQNIQDRNEMKGIKSIKYKTINI